MDAKEIVKSGDLAKLFGVTSRRIQQLEQEGIITADKEASGNGKIKRYELGKTVKDYVQYLSKRADGKSSAKEEEKLQAEIDLKRAKASKAQLELDELEGRMHAAEDVEAMTTDLVLAVRSALLSMPGQLSVDVAESNSPAEISEIIKRAVTDVLDELSRYEYNPDEYRRRTRERQGWLESFEEESDEE